MPVSDLVTIRLAITDVYTDGIADALARLDALAKPDAQSEPDAESDPSDDPAAVTDY